MFRFDAGNRDGVIQNLVFLYHACVASEGLLEEAGGIAKDRLADYYRSHLEEEKDEIRVLREDLASAGVTPGMPDEYSMAMVGTQYYLLKHVDPVCLLGYMAVQEADPSPIELVERLEELHGKKLFRFLKMHAIKDMEHRKELIELIDSIPEEQHGMIWFSADNTLRYLARAAHHFYLCWVARACYGVNNPKWLLFRDWLLNRGPKWLLKLYARYGERFSHWLRYRPKAKAFIRVLMDTVIALDHKTKTTKERTK